MELEIELQRAIATHLDWKERLRLAVDSSRSTMSVETACREDRCALGRLLESFDDETKRSMRWKCVKAVHADFHRCAGNVLELALAGRTAEARSAMAYTSVFAGSSAKLISELTAWKSEAVRVSTTVGWS